MSSTEYDCIVAGAGSSGRVLARRLACVEAGVGVIFPVAVCTLEQYRQFKAALGVPILASIAEFDTPPKYVVPRMVGFIRGKVAIHLARVCGERKRNVAGQGSWARGYFVSMVSRLSRAHSQSGSRRSAPGAVAAIERGGGTAG